MKKNWIALVSLALNLVLVALVLWQGSRLDTLEQDLWNVQANLLDRQDQVMDEVDALREDVREGERLIADWSLEPAGLDSETQSLLAEVVLQLRQWGADTSVKLTILTPAGETVQTIPADVETQEAQEHYPMPAAFAAGRSVWLWENREAFR